MRRAARCPSRRAPPAERGRDRLRHRRGAVRRRRDATAPDIDWGRFARDHYRSSATDQPGRPGLRRLQREDPAAGGFALPHGPRDDRTFATGDGQAQFTVNELTHAGVPPGTLLLQTIRSHDQYNTTIYGLDDRYRGIHDGRRVVFVSAEDLADRGPRRRRRGRPAIGRRRWRRTRRAPLPGDRIPDTRGSCAAYYPETNVLVPLASTNAAGTPTFKSTPVTLTR